MKNLYLIILLSLLSIHSGLAQHQIEVYHSQAGHNNGRIILNISTTLSNPPFTFLWSNGATTKNIFNLAPGTYTVSITNSIGGVTIFEGTVQSYQNHYQFPWTPAVGSTSHSLSIPGSQQINIHGVELSAGDQIGVFYSNSYYWHCAGYTTWNGNNQTITIHGDTGITEGMSQGKKLLYLIRQASTGYDYIAKPTYDLSGNFLSDSLFEANGSSALLSLTADSLILQSSYVPNAGKSIFIPWVNPVNNHASVVLNLSYPYYPSFTPETPTFPYAMINNPNFQLIETWFWLATFTDIGFNLPYQIQIYDNFYTYNFLIQFPGYLTDTVIFAHQNNSCYNTNDGYLEAIASFGVPPYTYLWNTGASTKTIYDITSNSTYDVTISDSQLNVQTHSFTTNHWGSNGLLPQIDANISPSQLTSQGSIALSITSNGYPGYNQYFWSTGSTQSAISNLSPGTYSVQINNMLGCLIDTSFVINSINFEVEVVTTDLLCYGDSNGTAQVNHIAGNIPSAYLWSTGETQAAISGLSAGNYSVSVYDGPGSPAILSFSIAQPDAIVPISTIQATPIGLSEGSISIAVNGGSPPFQYQWQNGATTNNLTNLSAGSYLATISDSDGCSMSDVFTILEFNTQTAPEVSSSSILSVCYGECNGSISVDTANILAPYQMAWSNGSNDFELDSLCPGNYSYTLTSTNYKTWNLTSPWIPSSSTVSATIQIDAQNLSHMGQAMPIGALIGAFYNDHGNLKCAMVHEFQGTSITETIWGDNPSTPYIKEGFAHWDDIVLFALINGITYELSVTWNNGFGLNNGWFSNNANLSVGQASTNFNFTNSGSVSITEPNQLSATANVNMVNLANNTLGSIHTLASGGTPPYTFAWSNGESVSNLQDLEVGWYTLSLTDANGCSIVEEYSIQTEFSSPSLSLQTTSTNASCYQACDGEIALSISGATPPYSILWNNGETSTTISGLCQGNYSVTVSAFNKTFGHIPLPWNVDTASNYAELTVLAQGLLIDGQAAPIGTPIAAFYNDNGSWKSAGATLFTGSDFTIAINGDDATTTGIKEGFAPGETVELYAQINDTTYLLHIDWETASGWSPGQYQNNALLKALQASNLFEISQSTNKIISEPSYYSIQSTVNLIELPANPTGSIEVIASGATPPYTYNWSNGETSSEISNLLAGTYVLSITDANGCEYSESFLIQEAPSSNNYSIDAETIPTSCFGNCDGSIDLSISNDNLPYDILWDNGATTELLDNLCAGNYSVTIHRTSVIVDSLPTPWVWSNTGVNATMLIPANSLQLFGQPAPAGILIGAFFDDNGVLKNAGTVYYGGNSNAAFSIWGDEVSNPIKNGFSLGEEINLFAFFNNTAYKLNIDWNISGNFSPPNYFTNLIYAATSLSNTFELSDSLVFTIEENDSLEIAHTLTMADPVTFIGGSIATMVSGGVAPYQYEWSNGSTQSDISDLEPGAYHLLLSDANACEITAFYLIDYNILPNWNLNQTGDSSHVIDIPFDAVLQVNGVSIPENAFIGVFYDSLSYLTCGGYGVWKNENLSITAYANNITGTGINGFNPGDPFEWKIWIPSENADFEVFPVYNLTYPDNELFAIEGYSGLDSLLSVSISGSLVSPSKVFVNSGEVIPFLIHDLGFEELKPVPVIDGNFHITDLKPGKYIIQGFGNPIGNPLIPGYVPTALYWQDAQEIEAYGLVNNLICTLLPETPCITDCFGSISGRIYPETTAEDIQLSANENMIISGKDAELTENFLIILFNQNMDAILHTLSDNYGNFSFPELAYGTYYIHVEKIGFDCLKLEVVLSADNPNPSNADFYMEGNTILSTDELLEPKQHIQIYPNPFSSILFLEGLSGDEQISVFSISGQLVAIHTPNSRRAEIKLEYQPAGVYFVKLESRNRVEYFRVIKSDR